jgi:hypothetical protein
MRIAEMPLAQFGALALATKWTGEVTTPALVGDTTFGSPGTGGP